MARMDNGMIPTDGNFGGEPELCSECKTSLDDCRCLRCNKCGGFLTDCRCLSVTSTEQYIETAANAAAKAYRVGVLDALKHVREAIDRLESATREQL